jgi:hypothetical protein
MKRKRMAAGEALATALVLPLAGCASGGRVQLSMQKMCQSHGGVWSRAQETCGLSPPEARQAAKQAKDICSENGGAYLPGGTCLFEGAQEGPNRGRRASAQCLR